MWIEVGMELEGLNWRSFIFWNFYIFIELEVF